MHVPQEKGNIRNSTLMEEARIYTILQGKSGIPKILWSGTDGDDKILILELLGPNLLSLLEECGGRFTLRTVLLLAIQMIGRIEYVHSKGFLHRDIKPENFVMGVGKQRNQVYIIDFGIAKSYLDPATNRHIPNRALKNVIGTPRYASWNAHCLNEPSRRDDLESLGYVLIYLLRGRLPWQGIRGPTNSEKYAMQFAVKHTFLELIMPIPTELANYLAYCDGLEFDEKPDYDYLKQLFYDRYCSEATQIDTSELVAVKIVRSR
uniref:non-specific serine/threonine protein kinase n=1 Tax=Ananas comosus var. bracteatus TaxID=296719 RepID=A0A6V7NV46_ANACO|nr:unnamed protein product [Ananas comosus var. bracteatus]